MYKDALGNPIAVGNYEDDQGEIIEILEITPLGHVIAYWFGTEVLSEGACAELYPEGKCPEFKKFGGWDWYRILEEEYSQKPRDEFLIFYATGNYTFQHKFRCIGREFEYDTLKELHAEQFNELEDQIKEYLMSIT